ncbi:MAG: hypothetical protein PHF86_05145 [Candidatus Nanoarchaeia archaeon]|jgi:hypothetical protein|nr:hypothetical protein [Candidatus Nanoarchaeia archaeon]
MSKILNLKNYLKEQAAIIRTLTAELKLYQKSNSGADGGYFKQLKYLAKDYRLHHIAYSLLKGKTYEQIEKCCAENNKPDMAKVQEIKNAYTENVCVSAC